METLKDMQQSYINRYQEKKLVLGEGIEKAKIMFIGEAPGENEERQGKAFVGKAGKNLDEFLAVVQLKREEIYITNVVKFRPTKNSPKTGALINRPPTQKEVEDFIPLLKKEIEVMKPSLIVTLGNVPLRAVLEDKGLSIGDVHGMLLSWKKLQVFPLYHPAAIIYNQSLKTAYNEDLQAIKQYL